MTKSGLRFLILLIFGVLVPPTTSMFLTPFSGWMHQGVLPTISFSFRPIANNVSVMLGTKDMILISTPV